MLPGWCCIANRHIGAGERRQLIPHVRFQVPFLGPESQLKSGFACAGLLCSNSIYAGCLNKRSCNFLFVARVGLCCGFCDFAVSFLVLIFGTARRSQKWDRESAFSFVLLLSCACGPKNGTARRSHFWDRV